MTPERIVEAARRKLGLPLIVAEWGGTELRELTPEDYPAVCTLVRETHGEGMSAEGMSAGDFSAEGIAAGDFSAEGIAAGDFSAEGISAGDFSAEEISVEDFPSETKLADPEYYDAYVRTQYTLFGYGLWGLFRKDSGKLIGIAGFSAPPDDDSDLELGYHIAEAFRRQGYGLAAGRAALAYAADELGAERITLRIRRENRPSLCLSEKLKASLPQMKGRLRINVTIL